MNDTKDKEQVMQSDLANMKSDQAPKKTWFFERTGDGMIFPCEEKEAWDICNNRSEWKRRDFKILGTSDGKRYQQVIKDSRSAADRIAPQITALEQELARYVNMEDKYMMDNIVDMDDTEDPENVEHVKKVKKLQKIISTKRTQLIAVRSEFQKHVSDAVTRAIAAELEVAKTNKEKRGVEWPSQVNIITPDASPETRAKILNTIRI